MDQTVEAKFKTSDLYFAAFLRVAGVTFLDTEKEGTRVFFVFENQGSRVMRDLKREYFNGSAKVSALEYAQAIKVSKTLLHER